MTGVGELPPPGGANRSARMGATGDVGNQVYFDRVGPSVVSVTDIFLEHRRDMSGAAHASARYLATDN